MTYPKYTMKPFDMHIDGGFGAIADSFIRAAEKLTKSEERDFLNAHLPINFLYRHATELYLKSIIIVIHSSLGIPYGEEEAPHILINRRWKPINRVHAINDLYNYFEYLVIENRSNISKIAQTDWADIPPDLKEAIEVVAQIDNSSTYFRYPSITDLQSDNRKSSWNETNLIDTTKSSDQNRPIKVFVELDDDENVINTYKFNYDPLEQVSEATKTAAKILESAHLGIRIELADGQ